MSVLADILKEIPLSAILKEKVATIEAENATLKTENAVLKDDLREAKTQLVKLGKRIEELANNPDLDETDVLLLKEIALANESEASAEYVANKVNLKPTVVELRLRRLTDTDYVIAWSIGGSDCFSLQPKSRAYLIKNNLI